jgi:hypothetical protein
MVSVLGDRASYLWDPLFLISIVIPMQMRP